MWARVQSVQPEDDIHVAEVENVECFFSVEFFFYFVSFKTLIRRKPPIFYVEDFWVVLQLIADALCFYRR